MRRPLGCLTFSALVAAVLVAVAILGIATATGHGIFSPGQLSRVATTGPVGGVTSHADLANRCDACHAPVWSGETMGTRCLACHTQVHQEITSKGGLHGRLLATTTNCRDCHTDHRGVTATLTLADPRVFPHNQTGYSLDAHPIRGQGGDFTCQGCHPGSPVTFSAATTAATCIACHQARDASSMELHQATFGAICLNCHNGGDAYGKAYAHATYALVGGHKGVQCSACHNGATTVAALRATPTTCIACHAAKDIHQGRLGTKCDECHAPTGWTSATIDHNKTGFVLTGQHLATPCESCHVNRQWTGIGQTCRSCHTGVNPHGTQFPGDCAACHGTTGWKNLTFSHATTPFPLVVAHAKPACVACHPGGQYVGTPMSCVGCHAGVDRHNGSLGKDCAACHKVTTWADWTFNHSKASFQLTGAHSSVACERCHAGGQYTGTPTACVSCHTRPTSHGAAFSSSCGSCHSSIAWKPASFNHSKATFKLTGAHIKVACLRCHAASQYAGTPTTCAACHAKPSSHGSAFPGTCQSCHSTTKWLPATFDHSKSSFQLSGAHRSVACDRCHAGGRYAGTPTACASCHSKPSSHGSAFPGTCQSCHSTTKWLPATFDHSKSSFPLTGAHGKVACTNCHAGGKYAGTPTACASCHTKPSSHDSSFAGTCQSCHSTTAWTPASYNGAHTFPMTHGSAKSVCATCHPSALTSYSCAKCHSNSSMTSHHSGVSGFSLTTCVKCHPTGRSGG